MARQEINLSSPNDNSGDTLRNGGQKINENFIELYNKLNITKETANVTGTKTIDWAAYGTFVYTMTADTTFSDSNLPTGDETSNITMVMTGDFVGTFPAYWEFGGDAYDGTLENVIACEVVEGDTGVERVIAIITNLG